MYNALKQLKIMFESEYSPSWISPKKYDFYLPNYKIIIEMDGGVGHGKRTYTTSKQTPEETKFIDEYKDKKALEHGIYVIRINSDVSEKEYMKEKIKNAISNIFNLDFINWDECEEYALSTRIKEACDLWNNGNHSTTDIGEKIGCHRKTVNGYLKIGENIGWCKYLKKGVEK